MSRTYSPPLRRFGVCALLLVTIFTLPSALAQNRAPDASAPGPLAVGEGTYYIDPAADPDVLPGTVIQIAAEVYYPNPLSGRYPLLVYLHGNHGTCGRPYNAAVDNIGYRFAKHVDDSCQWTGAGTCPAGYYQAADPTKPLFDPRFQFGAPSHLGYDYLARRMASNGYIVVSINANRGITCGAGPANDTFLIFARGRLVLKHLVYLSDWDLNGVPPQHVVNVDLFDHIDFSNVGLMGHSRGGEGVRAAYNLYYQAGSPWKTRILEPVTMKSIFEFAPTDNVPAIAGNNLEAEGIVWNVLLPMCDGDVSNLQGVKPFDRMMAAQTNLFEVLFPTQKSNYTVWGGNHNFYNTEWQTNEADIAGTLTRCTGPGNSAMFPDSPGSLTQRLTGLSSLPALMRGNVGGAPNTQFNRNFNTLYLIPQNVWDDSNPSVMRPYPRRVDRGFTISPSIFKTTVFEDFNKPTGTNSYGVPNDDNGITINHVQGGVPNHDPSQYAAEISWAAAGANVFFETNWTAVNAPGRDTSAYKTLDIRLSRQDDPSNPVGPTDFSIQLVGANGVLTRKLLLSQYTDLRGPVGGNIGGLHPILQTVRIPLTDFGNYVFIAPQVRGVRFTFDRTASGAIYMANVRLSFFLGSGVDYVFRQPPEAQTYDEAQADAELAQAESSMTPLPPAPPVPPITAIRSLRSVAASPFLAGASGVEIEVISNVAFPVHNEGLVLRIGSSDFTSSRFPNGDTHMVIFTLTRQEFDAIPEGAQAVVQFGRGPTDRFRSAGAIAKAMLDRGN